MSLPFVPGGCINVHARCWAFHPFGIVGFVKSRAAQLVDMERCAWLLHAEAAS